MASIPKGKGPFIGLLLDDHGGGLTGAVTRIGFNADEHRGLARMGRLQGRGKLEAVRGYHPVVVITGGDHGGGVTGAGL